ncbi:immunoglobulin-like domain-containing protein [Rhodohalobacter sp. 8-1]|uniref:immunoglobulin-like domain-containing protein n=1 Tax=Rhodohalobacter sp. 8-1 TaxID=3131972 RepID=UPI0030ED05D3
MNKTNDSIPCETLSRLPVATILAAIMALAVHILFVTTPAEAQRPGTFDPEFTIEVRFAEDAMPQARGQLMSSDLRRSMVRVERLFSASDDRLREIRKRGQLRSERRIPALEAWYRIIVKEDTDIEDFINRLLSLPYIEIAEQAAVPVPAPFFPGEIKETPSLKLATTPLFEDLQGYLEPAPDGIDAFYSWDFPGGNGAGFTVYDVEYSWNQSHEDLSKLSGISLLLDSGDSSSDPFNDTNHGTAVMGELIADNDDKGVTGISWGADGGLAPANTSDLGYNPANAIALAAVDGNAGDVILIEQQTCVCNQSCSTGQQGLGPTEWITSVYDAIVNATAAGFIVVQAAGNGGVDLDQESCGGRFDRDVQDSGAIIVGAGSSTTRERLGFSSYGSRVDLQGWGQNVMTTGYGTHYTNSDDTGNDDFWYRRNFGGTSSASPIVSGAVLNLQGINKEANGTVLSADEIATILKNTGTPQGGDTSEHIGPLPNLRMAIAEIVNVAPVADAGPDQTLECDNFGVAAVSLDGSGSFDDNGDMLTYSWSAGGEEIATGVNPNVSLGIGVHVVTLTVKDSQGLFETDEVIITVEDTTPPDVTLLGDDPLILECGVDSYEEFGAEISDICDADPALVIDAPEVNTSVTGEYTINYTGTDANGNSTLIQRQVIVEDTTPPDITLLGDDPLILECGVDSYNELGVDISDFCDADPALVIDASDVNTSETGEYLVDYTGTDASGNFTVVQRKVIVEDTTPPQITVNSPATVLWSPNHEYRILSLADLDIEVEDACDQTLTPENISIVKITSDEPENANGNGDGNTPEDIIVGETCDVVQLRAERAGNSNGRVYTLHLELMDASGNIGTATHEVHVPISQRPGSIAEADDPAYEVISEGCEPVFAEAVVESDGPASLGSLESDFNDLNEANDGSNMELPTEFGLEQNYPNPFNPVTIIPYMMPEEASVRLSVFNMLGQEVMRLVDGTRKAGRHQAQFDASSLPSGLYIYSITAGNFRASKTMVLLK